VATLGIFGPSFFFVWVSAPLVPRLRASKVAGAFLDGVTAAAVALILLVALQLGRAAVVDEVALALLLAGLFLIMRRNTSPMWLVCWGAAVGLAASALGLR
jgi:chromate transporter